MGFQNQVIFSCFPWQVPGKTRADEKPEPLGGGAEEINLPANPAEKLISLSFKKISGKLKTSDSLTSKKIPAPLFILDMVLN
jgi:hypothetical protein